MAASRAFTSLMSRPYELAVQRDKTLDGLKIKQEQVRLQQEEAAHEHKAVLTAAVEAEADSTSKVAELRSSEAMLNVQRGENDVMKDDVAKLQQELEAVRAQAHDQSERFIEECMRLDADIGAVKAAHPDLAFTWHLTEAQP